MAKDVLIEIGLEELPARFIDDAASQLNIHTEKWLEENRISYSQTKVYSTPRRLAVLITEVAELQTSIEEEVKGPAMKIAKDEEGNWSKAAIGFTRGQGKTVEDIYVKELNETDYIYVKKYIEGKAVTDLLPEFKTIITNIQFGNTMRWGSGSLKYVRPIRWLVALYGEDVIPFHIENLQTGNTTDGHRFLGKKTTLKDPASYEEVLEEQYVIVDPEKREELIKEGIQQLENKHQLYVPVEPDLLNEVRNLVEYPTVFIGTFEESFLDLPDEVLITTMKEHQRYFPVKSDEGTLLANFVGVRNGDDYELDTVVKGNEKVLRARFADAVFFYEEDQSQTIDFYQNKLERVVFQEKLGTYSEKVGRIVDITKKLTSTLNVDEETATTAARAAEICKFDLMTDMVNEFTELQGVMGEKYALHFGESEEVAKAISEHYLPEQSHGKLPESPTGSLVSVADKLDTITGCISVGIIPTGSQDPYGLRRQATGILRIAKKEKWNITVESLIELALAVYGDSKVEHKGIQETRKELEEFFNLRASYLLKEEGIEQDIIHAVLDRKIGMFDYTMDKAHVLSNRRNDPEFKTVEEALIRVLNLTEKTDGSNVNPDYFETESEKSLYKAYQSIIEKFQQKNAEKDANGALLILSKLTEPIRAFFDNTMVMAEDEDIRNNRLALVTGIGSLIKEFANFKLIEWKQQF